MDHILYVLCPLILLFAMCTRVASEYQRYAVFRWQRCISVKGPGLFFFVPFLDQPRRFDLRVKLMNLPEQHLITRDNVSMKAEAVCIYQVIRPEIAQGDPGGWIYNLAQRSICKLVGETSLDDLLHNQEIFSENMVQELAQCQGAGVNIQGVYLKKMVLSPELEHSLAKCVLAERERRAKVIAAHGEFESAEMLVKAAGILGLAGSSMQLRYWQTMAQIGREQNTKIIFPIVYEMK